MTGAPRLAGLPQEHLAQQLAAYAEGARRHSVMEAVAKALTPQERAALAAYYAALPATRPAPDLGKGFPEPRKSAASARAG